METQRIQLPLDGSFTIPPERHGQRLDQALAAFFADLPLRARRRIFDACEVLVDGAARPPAFKVKAGQTVAFAPRRADGGVESVTPQDAAHPPLGIPAALSSQAASKIETALGVGAALSIRTDEPPRLLGVQGGLAFLSKPAGLHSEGRGQGGSLEESLPSFGLPSGARLLTRLDYGTSGLCLAALDAAAWGDFRAIEMAGRIRKGYLCLLDGEMRGARLVAAELDTKGGTTVRVRASRLCDRDRRTGLAPLAFLPQLSLTLTAALITRGARHQIRAHAARSGHPVHGDPLYGAGEEPVGRGEAFSSGTGLQPFFLHSAGVVWPGGSFFLAPPWQGLAEGLLDDAMDRLKALLTGDQG